MCNILLLNRVRFFDVPDLDGLSRYQEHIQAALNLVPGYQGGQIWQDLIEPAHFLTLNSYSDIRSAEQGLRAIADESLIQEYLRLGHDEPKTTRVRVLEASGELDADIESASFLSISFRIAEPGRSHQLHDDLRRVFEECGLIPGFTGYLIGVNDALEEETIGLASWASEGAFRRSLPKGIIAKVRCFARAFPGNATRAVVSMEQRISADWPELM